MRYLIIIGSNKAIYKCLLMNLFSKVTKENPEPWPKISINTSSQHQGKAKYPIKSHYKIIQNLPIQKDKFKNKKYSIPLLWIKPIHLLKTKGRLMMKGRINLRILWYNNCISF